MKSILFLYCRTPKSEEMVRSGGFGGSVWVIGEWLVGVIRFQKMYGLYGLKQHIVEISGDVTAAGRRDSK